MLTKKEKYVLKVLKKNYLPGDYVDTAYNRSKIKINPVELNCICKELTEKEYLVDIEENLALGSCSFYTTYKSHNYKEELSLSRAELGIKSFLIPIIVGVIVGILSSIISNCFFQ